MIGIGIAWASILSMPYAMLSSILPAEKMGYYMGVFNFFIVIPQIINALIGCPLVKYAYGNQAIFALVMSGVSFLIAAALVSKVKDIDDVVMTDGGNTATTAICKTHLLYLTSTMKIHLVKVAYHLINLK